MLRIWLLVADGERAKLFRKQGKKLEHIGFTQHAEEKVLPADKGHHQPGVTGGNISQATQTYASHVEVQKRERELFLREIAAELNHRWQDFDRLIVVAPPASLGDLRKHFNEHVKEKITQEITKDLTKTPIDELAEYIFS